MRSRITSRLALFATASLLATATTACDETADAPTGPMGAVEIATAPLVYPGITGATFAITVVDSLGETIFKNSAVSSDDFGTPDGRILFIAPCSAGNGTNPGAGAPNPATEANTVRVQLVEVRAEGGQVLTPANGDVQFPPPVERVVTCEENADVRAEFLLTFVRRAQQGFVDVVVEIQDVFCSYKVSCEQGLMADPDPPYAPGPTLVTGFACTDGEVFPPGTNYVGFVGSLCCNGAEPGDATCTTLGIDGETGAPIWSDVGVGVLDTRSYRGMEEILGKVFHNTSWRLDPDAVSGGCTFYGRGHFNWSDDGTPVGYDYFPGADGVSPAPAFFFITAIGDANEAGEMLCGNPGVQINFGPELPPQPPVVTEGPIDKEKGSGLRVRRSNTGGELYVGSGDLGVGGNRSESEYPPGNGNLFVDERPYTVAFTYDPNKGISGAIQFQDSDATSRSRTVDLLATGCPPESWDRLEIFLRGREANPTSTTKFNDVKLAPLTLDRADGFSLGDFDAGTTDLYRGVTGFDFTKGFTVTGTLVTTGWGGTNGSAESAKLEIGVHCPAPQAQ